MLQQQDGRGVTKNTTSDTHNAVRRAKKAHQRAVRKVATTSRYTAPPATSVDPRLLFRQEQVSVARKLMGGMHGLMRKSCELVLDEFAEIYVPTNSTRTAEAKTAALSGLTREEIHESQVDAGQTWAGRLLKEAYDIVRRNKVAA